MSSWVVYTGVRTGRRNLRVLCGSLNNPAQRCWLLRRYLSGVSREGGEGKNRVVLPGVKKPLYLDPPTPSGASQKKQILSPHVDSHSTATPTPHTTSIASQDIPSPHPHIDPLPTAPNTPSSVPKASHSPFPHSNTDSLSTAPHTPVMVKEVLDILSPRPGQVLLDLTFGAGGHTRALLESEDGVRVVCLDRDPSALTHAGILQENYPGRVLPLLGCFSDLPKLLMRLKIPRNSFDGVLMDLGASSMQFDNPKRGFMLSRDGPLDMRMDGNRVPGRPTAAEVVAHLNEVELYKVLKYYGEEKNARRIARALVESRCLFRCPRTTLELADLVAEVVDSDVRLDKLQRFAHPATKTFQALRILVNNELNELDFAVRASHHYLRAGGLMVTLAFHSLEDTIVKRHITGVDIDETPRTIGLGLGKHRTTTSLSTYTAQEMEQLMAPRWSPVTRHVLLPTPEEVAANPRSRSARLRAAKKL